MTTDNKWWSLVEILKLHQHSEGYSDSCDIFHLICPILTELLPEEALSPFSAPWNPIDLLNIGTCFLSICSNQNREMKSNKRTWLFLKETESKRKNDSIFRWPVSTAHRVGAASWKDFGLFLFAVSLQLERFWSNQSQDQGRGQRRRRETNFNLEESQDCQILYEVLLFAGQIYW